MEKLIRYGVIARLSDVFHGYRDGRKGIPAAEPTGPSHHARPTLETPYAATLRMVAIEAGEGDTGRTATRQRPQIESDVAVLAIRVQRAESRLAAIEETGPDLHSRRLAELDEARRPAALVESRRRAEYERRRDRAETELFQLRQQHAAAIAELSSLMPFAEPNGRVAEYAHRRMLTYWTALLRSHPHGPQLSRVYAFDLPAVPEPRRFEDA